MSFCRGGSCLFSSSLACSTLSFAPLFPPPLPPHLPFSPGLYLNNLPQLTDLSGLSSIQTVGDELELVALSAVTDLSGLHNIRSVGGSLRVNLLESLASFNASLSMTVIGGSLDICNMPTLQSLAYVPLLCFICSFLLSDAMRSVSFFFPWRVSSLTSRRHFSLCFCFASNRSLSPPIPSLLSPFTLSLLSQRIGTAEKHSGRSNSGQYTVFEESITGFSFLCRRHNQYWQQSRYD